MKIDSQLDQIESMVKSLVSSHVSSNGTDLKPPKETVIIPAHKTPPPARPKSKIVKTAPVAEPVPIPIEPVGIETAKVIAPGKPKSAQKASVDPGRVPGAKIAKGAYKQTDFETLLGRVISNEERNRRQQIASIFCRNLYRADYTKNPHEKLIGEMDLKPYGVHHSAITLLEQLKKHNFNSHLSIENIP